LDHRQATPKHTTEHARAITFPSSFTITIMSDPFLDTTVCLQENSIEQLPIEAQSKLRSTQILTCIPQLISELLQNSLDAGASHVDIGVDCEEWSCWVRDDGIGISREGMDLLGSEGGRYGEHRLNNKCMPLNGQV